MRVEALPPGAGPATDAFSAALVGAGGPAAGLLEPVASLGETATGTGTTPRLLALALAAEQARHGLGPLAERNALALAEGALAVVAGQQPGLLGGPLLSLHKAAGAIALARALSARLGRPVVPVFWVASEDHDWDEVNAATVADSAGALVRLALDVRGDLRSVRDVPLPPSVVEALVETLRRILPQTPRAAAAAALATPPAETDIGSWFALLLGRLLGETGLVVVEPHVLSPWAGPVYASLVRDAEAIAGATRAAGSDLQRRGLPVPLDVPEGAAPLFVRDGPSGPRRRVALSGDAVRLRGEPAPFDRAGLCAIVERQPELASGDVTGRMFLQDALLPVLACVGGPSELAYWAQVRAAHAAVGMAFPAAARRPSATWVEPRTEEAVQAFGLTLADVLAGRERPETGSAPARDASSAPVETLRRAVDAVEQALRDVPSSARPLAALRRAAEDVEGAARAARDENEGRGRSRWKKAADSLRPRGMPQERVLSPISVVARHGVEALRAGLAALDPEAQGHQLVRLD